MLVQLEQAKDIIKEAGLKSVALGIGQPKHAAHWGGKLAPSVLCLAVEANGVHYSYGLGRHQGLGWMFKPGLYAASAKAAASGLTQGEATGDIAMLGGIFIVNREGIIEYSYANDFAGDYPPIAEIIAEYKKRLEKPSGEEAS